MSCLYILLLVSRARPGQIAFCLVYPTTDRRMHFFRISRLHSLRFLRASQRRMASSQAAVVRQTNRIHLSHQFTVRVSLV